METVGVLTPELLHQLLLSVCVCVCVCVCVGWHGSSVCVCVCVCVESVTGRVGVELPL